MDYVKEIAEPQQHMNTPGKTPIAKRTRGALERLGQQQNLEVVNENTVPKNVQTRKNIKKGSINSAESAKVSSEWKENMTQEPSSSNKIKKSKNPSKNELQINTEVDAIKLVPKTSPRHNAKKETTKTTEKITKSSSTSKGTENAKEKPGQKKTRKGKNEPQKLVEEDNAVEIDETPPSVHADLTNVVQRNKKKKPPTSKTTKKGKNDLEGDSEINGGVKIQKIQSTRRNAKKEKTTTEV